MMTRALLFGMGLLLACGQCWAIQVDIDEPQENPIKLKYQEGGVQVTFHATITGLGDHTYKYWWTWEGGQTAKSGFTEDPAHVNTTHTFTEPGPNYMMLEVSQDGVTAAGDVKQVWVLKLEITEPDGNPANDHQFVFATQRDPNATCELTTTGTTHVWGENSEMWWMLDEIAGSTLSSDPDPAEGADVTFTYRTLPSLNSEFGVKTLHLGHPMYQSDFRTRAVEVFFGRDSTNHPGQGSGVVPNWYYYWSQTSASFGAPTYDPNTINGLGVCRYENGQWQAFIGPRDKDAYTIPDGPDAGTVVVGIDSFAYGCRHEAKHVQDQTAWWPNNWEGPRDMDSDWLPDALEWDPANPNQPGLGGTLANPVNGGPYRIGASDSDGDGYIDLEDYTVWTQTRWVVGAADSQDWASPGHQSTQ